jgi:N-acetylglutamate synthase-like GNAT family acetyltransferase
MKKGDVKIRKAAAADIPLIYSLGRKTEELNFSPKMSFHDKAELKKFVKKTNTNILLVAETGDRIVGFLYAKIISRTWCILDNLAVEQAHQGKGIGHLLLNNFYNILKKKKISYVQVLEEIHHRKTRDFWKNQGFKEEKVFVWADKSIK